MAWPGNPLVTAPPPQDLDPDASKTGLALTKIWTPRAFHELDFRLDPRAN